jgi:hypothetical protein
MRIYDCRRIIVSYDSTVLLYVVRRNVEKRKCSCLRGAFHFSVAPCHASRTNKGGATRIMGCRIHKDGQGFAMPHTLKQEENVDTVGQLVLDLQL